MKSQRGGFAVGFIVGLLVGLALALGVALYVTKVPVPFMDKVPQRTAAQDAAEAERNKNWDPNAALAGKPPQRAVIPPPSPASAVVPRPATAARETPLANKEAKDPAAILAGAASAPRSAKPVSDAFNYFVQAGAFARAEDAEQQRAKLAMLGLTARVTEREQSGRTMYRVRVGPFDQKDEAESAQSRLQGSGVEAALVRVER